MKLLNTKLLWAITLFVLISALPAVRADWEPANGHKMHFPQLPDPTGYDVSWQSLWSLGDDWQCSGTGPVKDIHFWVSFESGMGTPDNILNFNVEIWSNNPGDMEMPWSHPGQMLWMYPHPTFTWRYVDTDWQGWFDPVYYNWLNNNHIGCYQINIENIPDPFIQDEGEIYWLVINDVVTTSGVHVGWKESNDHFMDDAVWWNGFYPPWWNELHDPETPESMDLAFVITGSGQGPIEPKPLIEHSKWSQPPIEIDPTSTIPEYCGWDEISFREWVEPMWYGCWDCRTQCYGDADCDGDVDPADMIIFMQAFNGEQLTPKYFVRQFVK